MDYEAGLLDVVIAKRKMEVAVIGDEIRTRHLVQPLESLLTEGLMSGTRLT
ncbi:hypothetical protein [Pseudomonas fluorescens]|uniref:hypothetical protein n=1 Tax=Pseudomonas fluorescens TaxID=294 RepID=UPI001CD21816|nr:hypothetical protein [Pseudomonas fluorescens]